ncbi:hypothetical protein SASPL_134297 [Salvia splendens]|uniref:Uncharacterized protein n=2 Tax=Salvia splendens TaxID=180675 RepID=A0A8X8X4L8_SALSN|nr:hypothetical protein SASPL_134297 [Salvia splendens]
MNRELNPKMKQWSYLVTGFSLPMGVDESRLESKNGKWLGVDESSERGGAKQRRRELDGMPPVLQMENLNYEQLEQLRNSVLMYKQGVQAKFSGGAGVYGYGGNAPGYGQNVQYPPMGYNYGDPYNAAAGGFNANVGGAHAGANYWGFPGSSGDINSAQGGANYGGFPGSSDASIDGAQGGANYGGFPGNYYHHHPGYEQLEQLRNSLMMFEHGAEAKLNGGGSSAAAGVKPSPP